MITFIFNVGRQGKNSDVLKQVSMLVGLKADIDAATASLPCPNHKLDPRATILLSSFRYGCRWEILNSCCSDFSMAIDSAVSYCGEKPERDLTS